MKRQPNSAFAVINYGRTMHVCMDIHCPCGYHNHLDTWGDMGSAEYVRCAECKGVLRIGADVNLLEKREDFGVQRDAYTFIQWKGTDVVMQAHCICGKTFEIEQDFAYECDCPHCGKHYHCESCLEVTKLTPEEAAAVTHVQKPEKDLEDMTDEERADYESRMQAEWEKTHTCVYPPLRQRPVSDPLFRGHTHVGCQCNSSRAVALPPAELGCLVEPGHAMLSHEDLLGKSGPAAGAPHVVVLGGDFVDGALPRPLDFGGHRVLLVPDLHTPADNSLTMKAMRKILAGLDGKGNGNRKTRRGNRRREK